MCAGASFIMQCLSAALLSLLQPQACSEHKEKSYLYSIVYVDSIFVDAAQPFRDRYVESLEGINFFYVLLFQITLQKVIVGIAKEKTCRLHKNQSLQLVLDGYIWHTSVIMK